MERFSNVGITCEMILRRALKGSLEPLGEDQDLREEIAGRRDWRLHDAMWFSINYGIQPQGGADPWTSRPT